MKGLSHGSNTGISSFTISGIIILLTSEASPVTDFRYTEPQPTHFDIISNIRSFTSGLNN